MQGHHRMYLYEALELPKELNLFLDPQSPLDWDV